MHRKVAAALVAALLLVAAGCGGAEPLTRAQLTRRIETACAKGTKVSQRELRASRGSAEDGQQRFIAAVVAGQHVIADEIEDLEAPDSASSAFDSFKEGVRERVDALDRVPSAGAGELRRAMAVAQAQLEGLTRRVQDAARRLGVEGCE